MPHYLYAFSDSRLKMQYLLQCTVQVSGAICICVYTKGWLVVGNI